MAKTLSATNLLVNSLVPEDLRDDFRIYDKKGVDALLTEVAKRYPDRYAAIAKSLGDIGRKQAWERGETFGLEDFDEVIDRTPFWKELDAEESRISKLPNPKERSAALADLYGNLSDRITKATNNAALARRNNVAITVLTGARGKEAQLRDLISSPGFYADSKGNVIPWFIRNSFSEGLRPADYAAGAYAARSSVVDSKRATAKGGFLAKTLSRAAASYTVSADDCKTTNGIPLPLDEKDLRGRILQRDTAGYKAGTIIDRGVYADLKRKKVDEVLVRSPLTCNMDHGVCSKCYGVKAEGRFPKIGEQVGVTAATALGEPLTQQALSMKHVTSGKGRKKEFSGLNYIQQFMDSPEEFKDRAVVAGVEGQVEDIVEAPQGGYYIIVGGKKHYVPVDSNILVEKGDQLEAGDPLIDGLIDPEDILNLRGLGEARNYWTNRMAEMAKASSAGMDRRLFEVLARVNVDHVDLEDPVEEGYLPDDRVRYSSFLHRRQLPPDVSKIPVQRAVGKYLEQPVMHHTVGTKLTPRMVEDMGKHGFNEIFVSEKEPGFRPVFVRVQQVASTDDDWLASLGGSYLGAQLQQGVLRAQDTNIEHNIHPVPRLAVGVGYGDNIEQTGEF